MTVRQLIKQLQELGENNLDKEVVIFDGPTHFTPYKVEVLKKEEGWKKPLIDKVMID